MLTFSLSSAPSYVEVPASELSASLISRARCFHRPKTATCSNQAKEPHNIINTDSKTPRQDLHFPSQ